MTQPQTLILVILAATLALFLWGRFRHDVVALAALLACVVAGLVEPSTAFSGFGHPAVITVACALVLSRGLQNSGAVDILARAVLPASAGRLVSMAALLVLGAALSAFMNNVGAMALLMPVAIQLAGRFAMTPGRMLMPLAFATILGGMTTLVGTPPNLIVSGFREEAGLGAFSMFDFTPAGLATAVIGIAFILLAGWRLVPKREASTQDVFEGGAYFTEVKVPENADAAGSTLRALEDKLAGANAQVLALVRDGARINAPHGGRVIRAGDVLAIEADVDGLGDALSRLGLKLEEQVMPEGTRERAADGGGEGRRESQASTEAILIRELVVMPGSPVDGRSATDLHLRSRFGLNLLAVSREGTRPKARLRTLKLRVGDVLLMQGPADLLADFAQEFSCAPLAGRELYLPERRMAILAGLIMAFSIALVVSGLLPAAPAFALGVLASMVVRTVPPRSVYTAIEWPVIVLLGALIPVASAMESTGMAALIAELLTGTLAQGNAIAALVIVLVVTMFLSDVMNNAATAAVMCPIALGIASTLGVNPDAFLMAVAIGASCAFLTPIGHQNNTLILGPGGFHFSDYFRLGLPLEVIVVAVSIPVVLFVFPL